MKATYIQQGLSLDYKNSGSAKIEAGDIVVFGSKLTVAATEIAVGAVGTLETTGVFEMPKKASEAITAGAKVYFSADDGITTTSTSNTEAGFAVAAAAAEDATVRVKIG